MCTATPGDGNDADQRKADVTLRENTDARAPRGAKRAGNIVFEKKTRKKSQGKLMFLGSLFLCS